jgi:glyoxylase-like metal-dependent hydrolase (beta-lactamase superfamily II)
MIRQLPGTEEITLIPYVFSNIYLIETESGLILIDTGIPFGARKVLRKMKDLGYNPPDLHTIILTHAHFDHFGSAAVLKTRTGATIAAHGADLSGYEKGGIGTMPPPLGLIQDRLSPTMARRLGVPGVKIDHLLGDGDQIGEWHVIHTPGHTPGTISLFGRDCKVLITGGWAVDKNVPWSRPQLTGHSFVRYLSSNPPEIVNSKLRIAQLDFQTLLCSHLNPRDFPFFAQRLRALSGKEGGKNVK